MTKKSVIDSGKVAYLALSGHEKATEGTPVPLTIAFGIQTGRSDVDTGWNAVGTSALDERIWFVQLIHHRVNIRQVGNHAESARTW